MSAAGRDFIEQATTKRASARPSLHQLATHPWVAPALARARRERSEEAEVAELLEELRLRRQRQQCAAALVPSSSTGTKPRDSMTSAWRGLSGAAGQGKQQQRCVTVAEVAMEAAAAARVSASRSVRRAL